MGQVYWSYKDEDAWITRSSEFVEWVQRLIQCLKVDVGSRQRAYGRLSTAVEMLSILRVRKIRSSDRPVMVQYCDLCRWMKLRELNVQQ